jgi:hypothetical protein
VWSSDQSSWLQIQRSVFDSRRYHIFWEVVGLERGPLSLVSTTEELLGRKSSCSGLEIREYGPEDPLCWPRKTLYLQKLALTSLGRYSLFADSGHGVCFFLFCGVKAINRVVCRVTFYYWLELFGEFKHSRIAYAAELITNPFISQFASVRLVWTVWTPISCIHSSLKPSDGWNCIKLFKLLGLQFM